MVRYRHLKSNTLDLCQMDNVRQQVLSNRNLGKVGSNLGVDKLLIKNMGLTQVSKKSFANAVEAIHGAAYDDAGDDGLEVVHSMMEHLGLTTHKLLMVTLCDAPTLCISKKPDDN